MAVQLDSFVIHRAQRRGRTAPMAEYDFSKTIITFVGRYLAFPLLAHLFETSLFPTRTNEVIAAQYELAKGTSMYDYTLSLFEIYPGEKVPSGNVSPSILWCEC